MVWTFNLEGNQTHANPQDIANIFAGVLPELTSGIVAELQAMKPGETKEVSGVEVMCETGYLLEDGNSFMCCSHETARTFQWCEENCGRYYHCDTIAWANDEAKANNCES